MRSPRFALPFLLALAAAPAGTRADVIQLATGDKLDGAIESQDKDNVVIRTPGGRMVVSRGRIVAIELSGKELDKLAQAKPEPTQMRLASDRNPTAEQPREFEGTYTQLADLDRSREQLRKADARAAQARAAIPGLQKRQAALEARLDADNLALQGANPKRSKSKYNAAVEVANGTRAELDRVISAIAAEERAASAGDAASAGYRAKIDRFESDFAKRREEFLKKYREEDAAEYFKRIEARMARHRGTTKSDNVPFEKSGDHLVFSATAGGKGPVKLMLDTGASYVVVNADAAKRLGIRTKGVKTKLTIGNGSEMEGDLVTVPELRVGDSVARGVEVIVSAVNDKMDGMDGVLGMSFLKFFEMQYDPAGGTFTLKGLDLSGR